MKTFIDYIKTLITMFSFSEPKENKNADLYFCIFGLEAPSTAMLPAELQKAFTLAKAVPGYDVSYTSPHKSTTGEGIMYFGPKKLIKAEAFDVFLPKN